MKRYIIDSSSLIHFEDRFPYDIIPAIYDSFYALFEDGTVYSVKAVYEELMDSQELWADYKDCFRELTEEETKAVDKILSDPRFEVFKKHGMGDGPWADPHLIASAMVNDSIIIVTEENLRREPERKIAFVCEKLGIPYINLIEFLRDVELKIE